jgi:integrase
MAHISYRISGKLSGAPVSRRFPDTKEGRAAAQRFAESLKEPRTAYDVRARIGDREVSKTFARRKDADAFAATIEVDKLRGVALDPRAGRLKVDELATRWLESNPAKRPDTRATDEYHLRAHILPALGNRQIASVSSSDIQRLGNELARRLAPRTVGRALGVVHAMFAYALDAELIGRTPYRAIRRPRVEPTRRRLPGTDELALLIDAVPNHYRPMVYCATILGLRFSEVAGLRVGAIDAEQAMLSVFETVTRDGRGRPVFGPPQSHASRRTIAIPAPLREVLVDHLEAMGPDGSDPNALVFPAPGGGPIRYANWRNRVWVPACRAAGLDGLGFHDLRRLNASALVNLGIDVKTAQERLGHSDVRMTIGLYAQAETPADRAAAEQLGERFMPRSRDDRGMSPPPPPPEPPSQGPELGI